MLARLKGFADASSDFEGADFVFFGVPFDRTCSFRPGAALAPDHIRTASYNFETYHHEHGIDIVDVKMHDAGDIEEVATVDEMLGLVSENARRIVSAGKFPVVLGGEHSLSPGVVSALGDVGVISIDAHLDFRDQYLGNAGSHACSTRRISDIIGIDSIVPIGVRSMCKEEAEDMREMGLRYFTPGDVDAKGIEAVLDEALGAIGKEGIYLTIDIDGIDPAYAPGVGTPEPFGLWPGDVKGAIQFLAPRLVGLDIVEVSPPHDNGNTSALAARLAREAVVSVAKRGV